MTVSTSFTYFVSLCVTSGRIYASGGAWSRFGVDSTHPCIMTINKGKIGNTGSRHLVVTLTPAGFSPEMSCRSPQNVHQRVEERPLVMPMTISRRETLLSEKNLPSKLIKLSKSMRDPENTVQMAVENTERTLGRANFKENGIWYFRDFLVVFIDILITVTTFY